MPARRNRDRSLLEEALEALAAALDEAGAPWMVIGGIAVIARGVRRFTADIDATVRGDAVRPERLVEVMAGHDIAPRIEDAIAFARRNLVLLLRHQPTGVDLDVSMAWSPFEQEAVANASSAAFGRVRVPMPSAADLVVFKSLAARPKDTEDTEALLGLYPEMDLREVRRRVEELATLAESPELLTHFDATVQRALGSRPAKPSTLPSVKRKPGRTRRRG